MIDDVASSEKMMGDLETTLDLEEVKSAISELQEEVESATSGLRDEISDRLFELGDKIKPENFESMTVGEFPIKVLFHLSDRGKEGHYYSQELKRIVEPGEQGENSVLFLVKMRILIDTFIIEFPRGLQKFTGRLWLLENLHIECPKEQKEYSYSQGKPLEELILDFYSVGAESFRKLQTLAELEKKRLIEDDIFGQSKLSN